MKEYLPAPKSVGRVKVELYLPNHATKGDFKNATGVDTSKSAKKVDLASLKSNADKLDVDKLKNVPINLSNLKSKVNNFYVHKLGHIPVGFSKLIDLIDVVKNYVVKKMYIMLR